MALNVTPFVGTDNFNMETFNNMISQINSGVNSEISDVLAQLGTQLGTKAEIVYSSYVGTGTYGSNNPNSLTFDGKPKFVFVAQKAQSVTSAQGYYFTAVVNQETAMVERVATDSTSTNAHFVQLSWGDKTVSWYSIANAERQLNTSGTEYVYAIFY